MTKSNLWKKVFLLAHDSKGFRVYYNYSKEVARAWVWWLKLVAKNTHLQIQARNRTNCSDRRLLILKPSVLPPARVYHLNLPK